jgi:hypothetical protein
MKLKHFLCFSCLSFLLFAFNKKRIKYEKCQQLFSFWENFLKCHSSEYGEDILKALISKREIIITKALAGNSSPKNIIFFVLKDRVLFDLRLDKEIKNGPHTQMSRRTILKKIKDLELLRIWLTKHRQDSLSKALFFNEYLRLTTKNEVKVSYCGEIKL